MNRQLISPVLRSTPWIGFIPAGVLAVAIALVAGQQPTDIEQRFLPSRLAVLAIVIAVGFVFDDPATLVTDPTPSQLRLRRLIRTLSALLPALGLFTLVTLFAADDMDLVFVMEPDAAAPVEAGRDSSRQAPEFPWGRLALEMATMVGFVLAAAAAISRKGAPEPGRVATGVLLAAYAATWMAPESYRPWAIPRDQRWDTSAKGWWLAFTLVWLVAAILSWDSRVGWRIRRLRRGTRVATNTKVNSHSTLTNGTSSNY